MKGCDDFEMIEGRRDMTALDQLCPSLMMQRSKWVVNSTLYRDTAMRGFTTYEYVRTRII